MFVPTYPSALADLNDRQIKGPPPGSDAEVLAVERFRLFFSHLQAPEMAERLRAAYADALFFNDTVKTISKREDLANYLLETARATEKVAVEVLDVVRYNEDYYVRWRMEITWKRVKRGQTTTSYGISHLRFDELGQIVLHQDFWDAASGLYEHLPVVGWLIRWFKRKL